MRQQQLSQLSPVYAFILDGTAPTIALPAEISERGSPLKYEIEDEYGRKINGDFSAAPALLLPRLNAGYHHFKISGENLSSEALLLAAPSKMHKSEVTKFLWQQPVNNFKSLRRILSVNDLKALHYNYPFPCEEDLAVFFRLIQKKSPCLENNISDYKEQALYLALQSQMPINKDYADWANNHYDYNKINSFKTKEFAKKQADLVALGELALKEVDFCLRDITAFCRRRDCPVCIHIDMPLAANFREFRAWRDRKLLLSKQLSFSGYSDYVPYNPQALEKAFYEPFITLIRQSMAYADVLCLDKPEYLWQIPCLDMPFPDKIIEYNLSALLAIIAIESNRSRCPVVALNKPELPDELKKHLTGAGISLI